MRKTKIASCVILLLLISGCRLAKFKEDEASASKAVAASFQKWQVIGEGTDFLTVQIDLMEGTPMAMRLSALALDKDGVALRKVSSYAFKPDSEGKRRVWFYFFCYSPRESPPHDTESEYLKFTCVKDYKVFQETQLKYRKSWGSAPGETRIADLPAPPDRIRGNLSLKDYTFFAWGDPRKPDGYHVEGEIVGHGGRWMIFDAISGLKGKEEAPELFLPSSRGWIELATGKTHAMQEAVSPQPPYVTGWWDGKGYFHLDPPTVYGLKK